MKRYYRLIGIVILLIIFTRVDFQKIMIYLSKLDLRSLILVNLLILPGLFLKAYRWRYLLKLQGVDYSVLDSFMSYLGGVGAGIITPGRIGEAVKAVYLKEEIGLPLSEGLASVFLDRLFDLYILTLLGYLGLWYFLDIKNVQFGLFIFLSIFVFIPLFLLLNKSLLLEKISKVIYKLIISGLDKSLFEGQVKDFSRALKKIITQRIYLPFVFTILAYIIYFWQSYLLSRLAFINISYIAVIFFVSIASLVSMVPITILGIGTREAALIYLFSLVGLNVESAVIYSFLLFFSFYVVTGVLACIGWFIKGRKLYI